MKRVISYILILAILLSVIVIPVSAEDLYYYEVLDYVDDSFYISTTGSLTHSFFTELPTCTYIDFIVQSNVPISQCAIRNTLDGTYRLTIIDLGNGFYRCYSASPIVVYGSFYLSYRLPSGSHAAPFYFTYYSIKLYPDSSPVDAIKGAINVVSERSALNSNGWLTQENPGEVIGPSESPTNTGVYITSEYTVSAYALDWAKYDVLTFGFQFDAESITSIIAESNGVILPVEYNYFSLDNTGIYYDSVDQGSGSSDENTTGMWAHGTNTECYITVTVDVSSLPRNAAVPQVRIYGSTCVSPDGFNESRSRLQLWSVNGSMKFSEPNAIILFFSSLKNTINEWFTAWKRNNNAGQEEMENSATEASEGMAQIEADMEIISSATVPDLSSGLETDYLMPWSNGYTVLASTFTIAYDVYQPIFWAAICLALIAFLFFGRK